MSRWFVGSSRTSRVRPAEHEQQQLQPRSLAAAQRACRPAHLLQAEQELEQDRNRLALGQRAGRANRLDRCRPGVERVVILGQVADLDRGSDPHLTLRRLDLPNHRLEEDALARAVLPHDADAVAVTTVRSTPTSTGSSPNATDTPRRSKARSPPRACGRSRSAIRRRSSTGRSTLSMRSIWRSLLRACLMWRSSGTRCAQCRKRRTASSRRAISFCCVV